MSRKRFVNIVVIVIALVVLAGAGVGYLAVKKRTPATIEAPTVTAPVEQDLTTFTLKSKYLQNDPTAQAIASGKMSNYDIRTFSSIFGEGGPYSTENFAYKFLSALRMTGYTRASMTVSGQYVAEHYLNRAQRFNNLPLSPLIDIRILKIVDSALAEREGIDGELAVNFPFYTRFVNPPLNEPTKEHSVALLPIIFGELPSHLVVWNETNFKDFLVAQLPGRIKNANSPNYEVCDNMMYPEVGFDCAPGIYFGVALINKVPANAPTFDDFSIASTILHEYAHYLDRQLYNPEFGTSKGIIDTTGFYDISYNTSNPAPGGVREFAYRRPLNVKNEFVSAYAQGWKRTVNGKDYFSAAEDFAESFSLYVTDGKIFRELAESSDILKQKYNWLKTNVLKGQDYQSGDIRSIALIKQEPSADTSTQSTGAFNVVDYSWSLPDFVWNYKFLNGSLILRP